MNILLLGSGGREHALARKLANSPLCKQLFIAPGNSGTAMEGINLPFGDSDFDSIFQTVGEKKINMVVVGPETPLAKGIVDAFKDHPEHSDVQVIGPSLEGAKLESSKSYAKAFMERHNIPTAGYGVYTQETKEEAFDHIDGSQLPIVLKADGLAAGKGVLILDSREEAKSETGLILDGKFGEAGSSIVIEEFLQGVELSVFTFTDGKSYTILPTAKDYKRIGEQDTGLNTGGMGAISPVPFASEILMQKIEDQIIKPTILGLQTDGIDYKGIIYFGLMNVNDNPFVIEYNVRFGDPEAEVLIPKIKSDLVEIFDSLTLQKLDSLKIEFDQKPYATIMLVSGGYPEKYEKGKPIAGLEVIVGSQVFHAGAINQDEQIVTNGGRVLSITSKGETLKDAINQSLFNAAKINFEGKYYRKDIGYDVI